MSKSKPHFGERPVRYDRHGARAAPGVDLGHEPPLDVGGGDAADVDRREINLRWLGASVLTGITGGALIGASIYIALEGATILAQPPERAVASVLRGPSDERVASTVRKGSP